MTIEEQEWRKLCDLVAKETDPQRLSELVNQIIGAIDAQQLREHEQERRQGLSPNAGSDV